MADFNSRLEQIVDDLALRGWSVCDDFLPQSEIQNLARETAELWKGHSMRPAAIGKGMARNVNAEIRGDFTLWLDETRLTRAQQVYFDCLEELRRALNAHLQLALFDFEGHLAAYPPGAFYRKHLDRFKNDSLRTLSCILYLNPGWKKTDGGQMRLYLEDGKTFDVLPQGGTLVTFLSDRFWHEVLPAQRERLSLTGWFRVRGDAIW